MLGLYTLTLFLSAGLLFLVQPLFAKLVLPLLGGTPAVWNTCMVFFQAALLAGYAYAHFSTRWLGVQRQALLHMVVLLVPLAALPLAVPRDWTPPVEGNPIPWLLGLMAMAIGLPFFVVASTAPLLQKWFSATGHHTARDPYYLYAASNVGSMLALVAYPALVEPLLGLREQTWAWSGGYAVLVVLIWACAAVVWKQATNGDESIEPGPHAEPMDAGPGARQRPVTWWRRLRWIALAAAPSSLMLGVTTYITTDLAVVPLLWVIPLALYLLTFIVVFSRRRVISHRWMVRLLPMGAVALLLVLRSEATQPVWLVSSLHLAVFFMAGLACHGELARDRPATSHLTEFYLLMSVGGMVGGMFNALAAPLLFTSIAEYPVALAAACLLVPSYRVFFGGDKAQRLQRLWTGLRDIFADFVPAAIIGNWRRIADIVYPLLLGAVTAYIVWRMSWINFSDQKIRLIFTAGLPAVVCFLMSARPVRFGLALAAVFFAGSFDVLTRGFVLDAQRSFYGVHRVTYFRRSMGEGQPRVPIHLLYHGTTLHGVQFLNQDNRPSRADEPLTYYHTKGPIGQVFAAYRAVEPERFSRVGVVGLGAGGLLAYGEPGDAYTVFEIDPVVLGIATNSKFFTFHRSAVERGVNVDIVLGDARLTLETVPQGQLDLLILDAFSSDSIPVHLLTREAAAMYLEKLKPDGLLVFHISNRYLELESVMAALAESLGMVGVIQNLRVSNEEMQRENLYSSDWVVLAHRAEDLAPLRAAHGAKWRDLQPRAGFRVWTDDYSNILSVFQW